jgi:uncharacterized protein YdcH (DUF465 family)
MGTMQRNPRDLILDGDSEYQKLAQQHQQYDTELRKLTSSTFLSSEDLIEEIKLKKLKLHCKDEMERIAAQIHRTRSQPTQ